MFDPDRVQTTLAATFEAAEIPEDFKPNTPIGYLHMTMDDKTQVTVGVTIVAALAMQLTFPVLFQAAKEAKKILEARG